jgi:hypothetical protein
MSSLSFRNTSGVTLEGGPVTVIDDEHYVGECMMDLVKPNEKKVLPYSVELDCKIKSERKCTNENVHRISVSMQGNLN